LTSRQSDGSSFMSVNILNVLKPALSALQQNMIVWMMIFIKLMFALIPPLKSVGFPAHTWLNLLFFEIANSRLRTRVQPIYW